MCYIMYIVREYYTQKQGYYERFKKKKNDV